VFPKNSLKKLLNRVFLRAAVLLQRKKHLKFSRHSSGQGVVAGERHRSELQLRTIAI
jgi:hypothetical protein